MPRTQPTRIGNSVIVSDKNPPEYGQYATVEDYDKVRNMLTLRPDQVSPNGPLTYKLLAPKATLATHGQPTLLMGLIRLSQSLTASVSANPKRKYLTMPVSGQTCPGMS